MTKIEKIEKINAKLTADIAAAKAQKEQNDADYYAKVAELQREACEAMNAATDDEPQTDTAKDDSVATSIYYDGTQTSLIRTIVAIFNDSPALPAECSFEVSVFHHSHKALGLDDETSVHLSAYNRKKPEGGKILTLDISECDSREEQMKKYTEWRKAVDFHFAAGKEEDNE